MHFSRVIQTRYELMLDGRLFSGHNIWYDFLKVNIAISFDCINILSFLNFILFPIIYTINVHHLKHGKTIYFCAGPYY